MLIECQYVNMLQNRLNNIAVLFMDDWKSVNLISIEYVAMYVKQYSSIIPGWLSEC